MEYIILGLLIVNIIIGIILLISKNRKKEKDYTEDFSRIESTIFREFETNRREGADTSQKGRQELDNKITGFQTVISEQLTAIRSEQNRQLSENTRVTVESIARMSETVDKKLTDIQNSNEKKLEDMRVTVDEKLQKTLETRLGQSFQAVSERLEQVQKGLGEMQSLATGVGDLKKVLTNVKNRGILGEIQLGNILEQMLSPEQYESNVATIPGKSERVEFAIKLPGKEDGRPVYMPIDSKFPIEDYNRLLDAYDSADKIQVDIISKSLVDAIKKSAKDINNKYIEVPYTTDFGILFLPVEGLYAEVLRQNGLMETLQRDFHIIIAGPTTLSALLNALQMGFKTLAIEKRSSEVWNILGAVKTEFSTFEKALIKAQKNIQDADKSVNDLITTRTNVMSRKLREVHELPVAQTNIILDEVLPPISSDLQSSLFSDEE